MPDPKGQLTSSFHRRVGKILSSPERENTSEQRHLENIKTIRNERFWYIFNKFILGFSAATIILGGLSFVFTVLFYLGGTSLLNVLPFASHLLNPWNHIIFDVFASLLVGGYRGYTAYSRACHFENQYNLGTWNPAIVNHPRTAQMRYEYSNYLNQLDEQQTEVILSCPQNEGRGRANSLQILQKMRYTADDNAGDAGGESIATLRETNNIFDTDTAQIIEGANNGRRNTFKT